MTESVKVHSSVVFYKDTESSKSSIHTPVAFYKSTIHSKAHINTSVVFYRNTDFSYVPINTSVVFYGKVLEGRVKYNTPVIFYKKLSGEPPVVYVQETDVDVIVSYAPSWSLSENNIALLLQDSKNEVFLDSFHDTNLIIQSSDNFRVTESTFDVVVEDTSSDKFIDSEVNTDIIVNRLPKYENPQTGVNLLTYSDHVENYTSQAIDVNVITSDDYINKFTSTEDDIFLVINTDLTFSDTLMLLLGLIELPQTAVEVLEVNTDTVLYDKRHINYNVKASDVSICFGVTDPVFANYQDIVNVVISDARFDPNYLNLVYQDQQTNVVCVLNSNAAVVGDGYQDSKTVLNMILLKSNTEIPVEPSFLNLRYSVNVIVWDSSPLSLKHTNIHAILRDSDLNTEANFGGSAFRAYPDHRGLIPTPEFHGQPVSDPSYLITDDLTRLPKPLSTSNGDILWSNRGVTALRGISELTIPDPKRIISTSKSWVFRYHVSQLLGQATAGNFLTIYDHNDTPALQVRNTSDLKLEIFYYLGGTWFPVGTSLFPVYVQGQKGFVTITLSQDGEVRLIRDRKDILITGDTPLNPSQLGKITFHGLSENDPSCVLCNFLFGQDDEHALNSFFVLDSGIKATDSAYSTGFSNPLKSVIDSTSGLTTESSAKNGISAINIPSLGLFYTSDKLLSKLSGIVYDVKGIEGFTYGIAGDTYYSLVLESGNNYHNLTFLGNKGQLGIRT